MGKFISRTITIGAVLCGICFVKFNFYDATNIEDTQTNEINQNNNMLSMMLETDSGSGQYEMTSLSSWPTNGYVFNEQMSKCEQGSILKWDDANKKVIMEGNVSDKCYVFFDKYNPIKINSSSVTANGDNIVITVNVTSGTGSISKYFYSKDNGSNYMESTSNTYTFANLPVGKYDVKYYVMDSNGKKSETISKSIEINSLILSKYIISKYTGTQGENNIYYHDANLTNGVGDNSYRYAGANPNNYVCFGSNESMCPTDNLYRIIGVFGDNVKLIKYDYANSNLLGTDGDYSPNTYSKSSSSLYKGELTTINRYSWNYMANNASSNTWSTSLFNKINLNKNYLNKIGTTWSNLIEDTTWKVSGHTTEYYVTPKAMYTAEITNATKTYGPENGTSKIGLMYVSDYGYAAAPSAWTSYMSSYNSSSITAVNWMYMGLDEWTITPYSSNGDYVFYLVNGGYLDTYFTYSVYGARPVLYLKASVAYAGGDGTKNSPIRIN